MGIFNMLVKFIDHSIKNVQLKNTGQIQPRRRVIILSKSDSTNIFKPIVIPIRSSKTADRATRR